MTPGEQTRDFYRKQGAEAEQKRIIELLKDYAFNNGPSGGILFAIALIKGENK